MPNTFEWTYAEYARLPDDGNRYEVIDGEVSVTPAPGPRHQHVGANLFIALKAYVERHDLGVMLWDVDLLFVTGQFLRPDMLFAPKSRMDGITDRGMEALPGLVVEVLSPHSARIDRVLKPERYRDFGVNDYWVVDPRNHIIEQYRLQHSVEPSLCTETLIWQPAVLEPLEIRFSDIFRGFAGDREI